MTKATWSLGPSDGDLRIHTGVAGPAAKMGHRLTIGVTSWRASVVWSQDKPVAVELTVPVDSIQVLGGEGGVTPLSGPEKAVARMNALKTLEAKKYPEIRFTAEEISTTADGYRLTGFLEIHGTRRPRSVDLRVGDNGDSWAMALQASVSQAEFGIKPYSLLMGTMRVADEVLVAFEGMHRK